jgi:hypothetical protein
MKSVAILPILLFAAFSSSCEDDQLLEPVNPDENNTTTLLRRSQTTRGNTVVDTEDFRSILLTDSELREAVGITRTSGTQRTWIESYQDDSENADGNGNAFTSGVQILQSNRGFVTIDERISELDRLLYSGEITIETYTDVTERLAGNKPTRKREPISKYGRSMLESAAKSDLLPVLICTKATEPALIPQNILYNEIANGLDREASVEIRSTKKEERLALTRQSQALISSIMHSIDQSAPITNDEILPCIKTELSASNIEQASEDQNVETIFLGTEIEAEADGEATLTTMKSAIQHHAFRYNSHLGSIQSTSGNSFSRLTSAVIDGGFADEHRAFKDDGANSRIVKNTTAAPPHALPRQISAMEYRMEHWLRELLQGTSRMGKTQTITISLVTLMHQPEPESPKRQASY